MAYIYRCYWQSCPPVLLLGQLTADHCRILRHAPSMYLFPLPCRNILSLTTSSQVAQVVRTRTFPFPSSLGTSIPSRRQYPCADPFNPPTHTTTSQACQSSSSRRSTHAWQTLETGALVQVDSLKEGPREQVWRSWRQDVARRQSIKTVQCYVIRADDRHRSWPNIITQDDNHLCQLHKSVPCNASNTATT